MHTAHSTQHTTQHNTTHNTQHTTHNTQHTTHNTQHAARLFLIAILIGGCAEQEQLETQQQPIVFGARNVETTRGLFELTRDSNFERELAYNLAAFSRTNASIKVIPLNRAKNCEPGQERPNGTLFMTSDTRALSAFHVIRTDQDVYGAEFEGPSSSMWPDTPADTGYNQANEWRVDLRHASLEEYPFLANRLFALGLEPWASQSGGFTRDYLRSGWRFEIESIPPNDLQHVQQTLWGQGFLPIQPTSSGKDIVLLRARELDPPNWSGIRPFPLLSPSVFFDQVEVAKPEHGFLGRNSTIEAVYTSPFVGRGVLLPTACVNGTYLGQSNEISAPICMSENATPQIRSFNHIHRSSLDSAEGTSGGAIVGPNRFRFGDGQNPYRWRQAFGVLHGLTFPAGNEPPAGWGDPYQSAELYSTGFTSIGTDWKRTNRDGPSPELPSPIFGDMDQHPGCTLWETRSHDVEGQTYTGTVCVDWGESTVVGDVTNGLPAPPGDPIANRDPTAPQHDTYFKIMCGGSYPTLTPNGIIIQSDPGSVVGLLGALHLGVNGSQPQPRSILHESLLNIVKHGGGIGSFFQICGPHSSEPFTSNWRFLQIMGNTIFPEWETLRGPIMWTSLRRALVTKFEERGLPDTAYFRPASFKTCPSGYLLNGFKLGKNTTHYQGVEELICVLPNGKEEIFVGTLANPESNYEGELFGRKFSMSQLIGAPGTSTDITTARCRADKPIIRGLHIAHDTHGRLNFVEPLCTSKVLP